MRVDATISQVRNPVYIKDCGWTSAAYESSRRILARMPGAQDSAKGGAVETGCSDL